MASKDLEKQVRQFASELSSLLNKTVTDGIRLSAMATAESNVVIGCRVSEKTPRGDLIPIKVKSGRAAVYLHLFHSYTVDKEQKYLTMAKSALILYTAGERKDDNHLVRFDYAREPVANLPQAHMHVSGRRDDLDRIYLAGSRKSRKLIDLHFPVGGKRFRPTLEDVIEFMVLEKMVEPRPGWKKVVSEQRSKWNKIQLKHAVQSDPDSAAEALREMGRSVAKAR